MRNRQGGHGGVELLDAQRISAQQAWRQRLVDVRLDSPCPVECLAYADKAAIGVNVNPEQIRELIQQDRLERHYLHG